MTKVLVTMEFDWPWEDNPSGSAIENTYDSLRRIEKHLHVKLIELTTSSDTVYGDNKPDPLRLIKYRIYGQELDIVQKAINTAKVEVVKD